MESRDCSENFISVVSNVLAGPKFLININIWVGSFYFINLSLYFFPHSVFNMVNSAIFFVCPCQ
jgi:hypothetical protein